MQPKIVNKIFAGVLSVGLVLQMGMPELVFAGGSGGLITPTVDVVNESIYANGTPITIEAGTLTGGVRNTKIKYNNGTDDVYLDLNPNEGGFQDEADLSEYKIYGGSNSSQIENTSITMTGGRVCNIYGGGYSADVSGDAHINISGTAEVSGNVYGGGYGIGHAVQGTAYITITGGDISQDHAGMVIGGGAEWYAVGHAEIKITGGNVNQVMPVSEPGGGDVTGVKTALVTVPLQLSTDYSKFTNALYKTDTQWMVKGNVALTNDLSITIAENETMIVSDGSNLTPNGNLTNNGTIIKKGNIEGSVPGTGSIVLTPIVDDANKAVYANGIPITILAGTSANQSKISYGEALYVDFNGNYSKDLTDYSIYGGSNSEEKSNSNIKMTGGSVENIYGQGKGYAVQNTTLLISGGTVSGTIEGGGENSTDNGYLEVVSNALKPETFDTLLYKETELKWKIKGEYTIPEKDEFWVDSNETLEIPENAILIIRGVLTNKGTIINNGKIIGVATENVQGTGVVCTEPVIDKDNKVIYANGVPIVIESGSDSEHSKIKYYDGAGYTYLKIDNSEDLLIKDYRLDGGAASGEVKKTSIIINGGNIKFIDGGNATESIDVIVTGDVNMPIGMGSNISCSANGNVASNIYVYYTGTNPNYIPYPSSDDSASGFKNVFCYYPNMPQTEDGKPEIIKGNAVIPKGYTVEILKGKEMTIPRESKLTIEGTLSNNGSLLAEGSIADESTGTLQGSGIFETTVFTSEDIPDIPNQLYTGNVITPTVTVNSLRTFMGKGFTVDTAGYTKSYENNTSVGTGKIVFTSTNGTIVEKTFNIVKSGTTFDGGMKTYKDAEETTEVTYGDTLTVTAKPKATGTASATNDLKMLRSFSAPTADQMALFVGNTQISDPVSADSNGVYTMTCDTKEKGLVVGDNTITAKYVGNSNMADYSEKVTITLNKKAITSAEVNTSSATASKEYDGTNSFIGVDLTLNSSDILPGDTVTATASGTVTDGNAGIDKAFNVADVTLSGSHKDYYSLDKTTVSGNVVITQATATGVNQEAQVIKDLAKEYTFDLTKLLPALAEGKSFGDITYTLGTVTNTDNVLEQNPIDSDIADGKINLKVANVADKDKTSIIQIKASSKNYKDFIADLTVKTTDKIPFTIEAVFAGGTYNGKPYAYTGTPTFNNGEQVVSDITYTAKYVGRDGTTYAESETAPKDAGKYNLMLTVSGESANAYAGTTTIGFEITKKQITAKPKEVSIKSNASFPAYTWSIETGIEGETITATNAKDVVIEAQENGTKLAAVKEGTFDIVFTTAPTFNQSGDTEKNYDIQMGKGKLTVTKYSGGGSSSGGSGHHSGGSSSNTAKQTEPAKQEAKTAQNEAQKSLETVKNKGAEKVKSFKDVKEDSWFYEGAVYVLGNGWFAGTTETTFSPSNPMTREMFRIVIGRMGSDVNGLMDNNRLKENITREQLVTLLYRMAQKKGIVKTGGQDTQNISVFADGTQVSSWSKEAMAWANAQGIIKGNDRNMITPKAGTNRAEVAVMLMRFDTIVRNH
ncbi:S-layer homology domain-containing protein [Aminipila sp.]|uniref:S-layer homology domain-containing protein n=1 Tax=Aminipila sp. TaxID=2060095 RepID=UPI00289F995D|nr:S-layer homology domain-containing protein [Aminipila sp.]